MSHSSPLIINQSEILSKYDPSSKISNYLDLLESENQKINLVSRETSRPDLERLAVESIIPLEIINKLEFQNYLDIGSGGGIPSFPIMLITKIQNSVLIERTRKKAAAIGRFSESLKLQTEVFDQTLEECELNQKFDLITLRLVRLSKSILSQIENLLNPKGIFVYYSHFDDLRPKAGLDFESYSYVTSTDSPVKSFTIFTA